MISLKITDTKSFMSKLLIKESFDCLLVSEATISTYNTFQISGQINRNFYSEEEFSQLSDKEYSRWSTLRPFCFELIRGSKTPVFLKVIFVLPATETEELISSAGLNFNSDDIAGLFFNIKFTEGNVTCVTGTSLKVFKMDKSLDNAFDDYAKKFLTNAGIDFEIQ